MTETTVDPQQPWPGLASFTEQTRGYFYGREDEVTELARRVQRKLLTILFGQSGLGKTSILSAGIVPRLRPEGYCPVYVRIDYAATAPAPSEQIKQAILRATASSGRWTRPGAAVEGESLWEFLHHRDDVLLDDAGKPVMPLLIFDQFEEIFTLAQGDDSGRQRAARFIEDLADLAENRLPKALEARLDDDESIVERFDFTRGDYRILIALREDYLAHLEGFKGQMPSITQNRMRLARMTGTQALDAVRRPGGALVNDEVAEAIVSFVAGGAELRNAEVEPSLLSLICRELNNTRIAQGRREISVDLLAGSRETILSEFYERALADQPPGVRRFIEDEMLTESGFRESLAEERVLKAFAAAGAAPDALATLVNRRLLRIEERLDLRRAELTHDVLCGVVSASRDLRHEREALEAAERQLVEQQAREAATRKALVRARQIAAGCAVLAVVALGSAVFGFLGMKRAQEAEAGAEATRAMAEQARGESEKLVTYLLDDFYLELAPVGRLDIVGDLARRGIAYYDALPAPLRTPQTERNRALALVRYGAVLRTQGKDDEGGKVINEAVGVLGRLREQGDASEATAIGLALGFTTQARLASSVDREGQALPFSERAVEIMKPLATAPDATVAARRAYGEALNLNGFLKRSNQQFEPAIVALEEARRVQRSIDQLQMNDLTSAAAYAEATAWQVQTYVEMNRGEDLKRAAQEVATVSSQVLERRPGHMQALRAQTLATSPLSGYLYDEMRLAEALKAADSTLQGWREFVRLDPGNVVSWGNLGAGYMVRQFALQDMGRPAEAAAALRASFEIERNGPPSIMTYDRVGALSYQLAELEATRGNLAGMEDALATNARASKWVVEHAPAGTFLRESRTLLPDFLRLQTLLLRGEYRQAIERAAALFPRLEALKPQDLQQEEAHAGLLRGGFSVIARAAYALEDYATAERAMTKVLELHAKAPTERTSGRRRLEEDRIFMALVLARLGRAEGAQELAAAALRFERELAGRNRDSAGQRFELAQALYVAAVAGLGDANAQLAEADAIMKKLPAEMQRLRTVAIWQEGITEEQARRRG
jgi:tetratricopeptide (TPR) repeat protein